MLEFALGWMRQGSQRRNDRGLYHSVVRTSAPSGTDGVDPEPRRRCPIWDEQPEQRVGPAWLGPVESEQYTARIVK